MEKEKLLSITKTEFEKLKNGDAIVVNYVNKKVDGRVFMKGDDVVYCLIKTENGVSNIHFNYKDIEISNEEEDKENCVKLYPTETYGERMRNLLSPYQMLIDIAILNNWLSQEQFDIHKKTMQRLIKLSHVEVMENNRLKEDEVI